VATNINATNLKIYFFIKENMPSLRGFATTEWQLCEIIPAWVFSLTKLRGPKPVS